MVAEVSDPRRRITGPVGMVAREFFQFNDAEGRPPEPYVYSGPVSSKWSPAWLATGAAVVVAVGVIAMMGSELSDKSAALAQSQAQLKTASAAAGEQADHIASLEKEKTAAAAVAAARDKDEQDARAKLAALKDDLAKVLSAEVGQKNAAVSVEDKHVRIELSDRLLFEDKGVALTDDAHKTLAKLGAALKKGDATLEVAAEVDGRKPRPVKREAVPEGAWAYSAARAALVAQALDEDGKLPTRRVAAKGIGRGRSRHTEIDVTP